VVVASGLFVSHFHFSHLRRLRRVRLARWLPGRLFAHRRGSHRLFQRSGRCRFVGGWGHFCKRKTGSLTTQPHVYNHQHIHTVMTEQHTAYGTQQNSVSQEHTLTHNKQNYIRQTQNSLSFFNF
jgi:hypothetical protein